MRTKFWIHIFPALLVIVIGGKASASVIFTAENPLTGPPAVTLFGGPLCFTEVNGSGTCDYGQVGFVLSHSADVSPKLASTRGNGNLISLQGEVGPSSAGRVFDTYFLGSNLSGMYKARIESSTDNADYAVVKFLIATDHLHPLGIVDEGGTADFVPFPEVNYYAVVFGYATVPVAFDFQISAVPEPNVLVLFASILALIGWIARRRISFPVARSLNGPCKLSVA